MKHLPSLLLVGALVLTLQAENPAPAPAPAAPPAPKADSAPPPPPPPAPAPKGDPFVKGADADAKAKEEETWKTVHLILEVYALDKNDANALLETEATSTARYRRVLELAKAGKARLEQLTGYTGKSGQRSVVESIDEVRYATEFATPPKGGVTLVPSAWETRNVGQTLEVEPVIEPDGRTCDLNLVPQTVRFLGFRDEPDSAEGLQAGQPIFSTQKTTTSVGTIDGRPLYLGTLSRPDPQAAAEGSASTETCLAFLHVSLLEVPLVKDPAHHKVNADGQCDLTYSFYSVDRADAREILVAPAALGAPWDKLQALVADKKARLEHVTTIKTKSGQRAVTEEVQEERFMSEYAPASHAPQSQHTDHTTSTAIPVPGKPHDADEVKKTVYESTDITKYSPNDPVVPGYPTAFETHNAGVTVEVEPVVGPPGIDNVVDLNEVVQSVKYLGNLKGTGVAARYPGMPLFEDAKITTSQSVPDGLHVFVSTMNPPGADGVNGGTDTGRTWLLFVRATVGEP